MSTVSRESYGSQPLAAGGNTRVQLPAESVVMSDFYVYVHSRLSTGEPFYIGKGRKGRCISEHSRNLHWKRVVAKDGGFSTSFLLYGVDDELARLAEIEAIDIHKRRGGQLVNMTTGGDGVAGYKFTTEQRLRLSKAHKGVKLSESHKRNAAASRVGRELSQQTKEKISTTNSGRKMTEEQRRKLSAAKKGVSLSQDHKRRISMASLGKPAPNRSKPSAMKGKTFSPEVRKRMSESRLGKKHSPERRARRSVLAKAAWARRKAKAENE